MSLSASLVTIQNDCFSFSFKTILCFLGVSFIFLCLPGVMIGDGRFWWHQDDKTSVQETIPLAASTSGLKSSHKLIIYKQSNIWFVFFLSFVLHLMTDHDLSSVSGISKYLSLKCFLKERWWLSCTSLRQVWEGLVYNRDVLSWLSESN